MNKHITKLVLILTSIICFCMQATRAQEGNHIPGKINIASPNASSIGKYGDIPVSYHTGVPQISIPIHQVTDGSLSIPISISYHAGGLRVEEQDSWVGAGWALNAGGVITRTVKSKPDEKQPLAGQLFGHFSDYGIASFYQNWVTAGHAAIQADLEPDLFSFNFNGYSGKFYFNDDRTPMLVTESDLKIETVYVPNVTWGANTPGTWNGDIGIQTFIITTPDGTKYYFGIRQGGGANCTGSGNCEAVETTVSLSGSVGITGYTQPISSWYLYKMVSADGNHSINLYYERDKYAVYSFTSQLYGPAAANPQYNQYDLIKNFVSAVRLREIVSANEKVEFTQGIVRQDLSRWETGLDQNISELAVNQTSKSLGSVKLYDKANVCYKRFIFAQDHFLDNTPLTHIAFSTRNLESDKRRLKLLSVQEQSGDGTVTKPPYTFDYFAEPVYRKLSFTRDHWGFNNGQTGNQSLYPTLTTSYGVVTVPNGNANREAAWPAMRGGTLKQITYPTGGRTNLEFEPHSFATRNYSNGQYVNTTDKVVGGLRVKKISNYDPATNQTIETSYSYQHTDNALLSGLSSGVLFSKPVYIQIFRNDWLKRSYKALSVGEGCLYGTPHLYLYSDNPIRPMETTQGNHIGYEEVKVNQTNNGYVKYKFRTGDPWNAQNLNRDGLSVTFANIAGACGSDIPNFPAPPPVHDFKRGTLASEFFYHNNGQLLKLKEYNESWQWNPVTTMGRLDYGPIGDNQLEVRAFYQLKTARKVSSSVAETNYQPGTPANNQANYSIQYFESPYHHQPTKIITTDSRNITIEKRLKYSFDYRVPVFENVANCNNAAGVQGSYDFLSFADNLYFTQYETQFIDCGITLSCYHTVSANYSNEVFAKRKAYIDCRRINYTDPVNDYQTKHDLAKKNANPELKTILWMQDNNMHMPIEVTEWKNNQLIAATYTKYNNNRNDANGVYPEKVQRINLITPSATFAASTVAADNINLTKDSRYVDEAFSDFNKGNIISVLGKDGVPTSYEWRYNQKLPVVEIVNAVNNIKEQPQPGPVNKTVSYQLGSSVTSGSVQQTFMQTQAGNIIITLTQPPNNVQITANINITGLQNRTASLCFAGVGGAACTGSSTITFTNMPIGQYTITYGINATFQSFTVPFNYTPSYTYQGTYIAESGLKEFFFDGFEENPTNNSNIVTGPAYSGTRYWSSNYTNGFVKPNARAYTIQWWNYSAAKWNFNTATYTNGMVLTGPVDNVRIFPTDAYMTTYTYDPIKGITSQTDANGRSIFYEYDVLNRLLRIRDQDNNLVKQFDYKYQVSGFVDNTPTWQPTGNNRCKPCPQNAAYSMNFEQQEQLDVNPNSPTYNTLRWLDIGPSSACGNIADWQLAVPNETRCEKDIFNNNTGFLEYKYKDMNPCSSTYNTFMWLGDYFTTSPLCPVSGCTAANCTGDDKKCINGVCETGERVNTDSYTIIRGEYICVYHYRWSDGTRSKDFQETNTTPCPF